MSLNATPSGDRLHIGFFGVRNAGKSSLVNAVTGQELSVVSDVKGTTTDPVKKSMELLPLGAVVIIDTPGFDDEGELGEKRVKKTEQILSSTDIAVLVADAGRGLSETDRALIDIFEKKNIPYIIAYSKADLLAEKKTLKDNEIYVSAVTMENVNALKDKIGAFAKKDGSEKRIVADLLTEGDAVVLVIPIDAAAPKGRLILPQQQTIRDILDAHCIVTACQETELKQTLEMMNRKPKMVITDSQAFRQVASDTPDDIMLTSFSILFARYKGDLDTLVSGAAQISRLREGARVLISEGCTHHRQCGDIGTVKIPALIEKFTGKKMSCTFTSGTSFDDDIGGYDIVIHCGGCMLNEREMKSRIAAAREMDVPIVNYGVAIAYMNGILERSLRPFPQTLALLK